MKRAGRDIHGVILLDKPAGMTSNRALQEVRRLLGARKAGHTGSLDPFATGMLPICLGEASKTAGFMLDAAKHYRATARLGVTTETGDPEGEITGQCPVPELDSAEIERVFARFRGPLSQVPPMYSALKRHGQPLYRLARRGMEVERAPRQVTIYRLERVSWEPPRLTFEVDCSKGTYVRTLAEDICRELGSCGHLIALRRLAVEPFREVEMVTLEALRQGVAEGRAGAFLRPADAGLAGWPVVCLDGDSASRFGHGNPTPVQAPCGLVRVHAGGRRILGLGEIRADGMLHPVRVFVGGLEESAGGCRSIEP